MRQKPDQKSIRPGFQFVSSEEIYLSGVKRIILAGDPGCTGFHEESRSVMASIVRQKGDALFILGDLAFTGAAEEFREIIDYGNSRVTMPVFTLCGNHDLPRYRDFLGLPTYTIVADNTAFVFLNNSKGYLPDDQIMFLKKTLKCHRERSIILAMHVPPPTDIGRSHLSDTDWRKLREVLDPHRENIRQIFSAHIHGYHHYELDGYPITITAGGGSAMIHEMRAPGQSIHHAIALELLEDSRITMDVIRIGNPFPRRP